MDKTIHEIVNKKMQEAGVTTDRPVYVIPDCYGPRFGQHFIPGAQVTVGEFTVIGLAYLSGELAQQVAQVDPRKDPQLWQPHCTIGEAGMNTYVLQGLVKNQIFEVEVVHAKDFKEALIALEFAPYDPWETFAVGMCEAGLITEERLEELRTSTDEILAEAVIEYAAEHWGPPGHYILEITPDGSITTRPEMANRMEIM